MILETGLLFNHVIKSAHNRAGVPSQPQDIHLKTNFHKTHSAKSYGAFHPKSSNFGNFSRLLSQSRFSMKSAHTLQAMPSRPGINVV